MAANDTNPPPKDDEVLKSYLTNAQHLKSASLAGMIEKINLLTANSFEQHTQENKKAADKKNREDKEFGAALQFACELAEIKLFIHLNILRGKIIEACRDNQSEMEDRYDRYQKMLHDRNPYPVTLPQVNQTVKDYQTSLLADAMKSLDSINARQTEVNDRMLANWGADNWEDGLKIKTAEIHEKIADSIDKFEFLNVIDTPDGKIDPAKIDPEAGKKAQAEMHKVNDELRDFLREQPAPTPIKIEDFNIVQSSDAPKAPPMAPSRSVIVGENAPVPPPPTISAAPTKSAARATQLDKDAELFQITQYQKAFKNIGEPLVKPNLVDVNAKANVDSNSFLRLAMRATDSVKSHIVGLQHDASQFVNDLHISQNLKKMKDTVKSEIVNLEHKLEHHHTTPHLKR